MGSHGIAGNRQKICDAMVIVHVTHTTQAFEASDSIQQKN